MQRGHYGRCDEFLPETQASQTDARTRAVRLETWDLHPGRHLCPKLDNKLTKERAGGVAQITLGQQISAVGVRQPPMRSRPCILYNILGVFCIVQRYPNLEPPPITHVRGARGTKCRCRNRITHLTSHQGSRGPMLKVRCGVLALL